MAAKAYVIVHGGVDFWRQGAVIPAAQFEKLDTQRLLDLGAIREATAEEAQGATDPGAAEAGARDPAQATGSADVPAVPPAPVDDTADKGKK